MYYITLFESKMKRRKKGKIVSYMFRPIREKKKVDDLIHPISALKMKPSSALSPQKMHHFI